MALVYKNPTLYYTQKPDKCKELLYLLLWAAGFGGAVGLGSGFVGF
jgi:hypothetical protein